MGRRSAAVLELLTLRMAPPKTTTDRVCFVYHSFPDATSPLALSVPSSEIPSVYLLQCVRDSLGLPPDLRLFFTYEPNATSVVPLSASLPDGVKLRAHASATGDPPRGIAERERNDLLREVKKNRFGLRIPGVFQAKSDGERKRVGKATGGTIANWLNARGYLKGRKTDCDSAHGDGCNALVERMGNEKKTDLDWLFLEQQMDSCLAVMQTTLTSLDSVVGTKRKVIIEKFVDSGMAEIRASMTSSGHNVLFHRCSYRLRKSLRSRIASMVP